MGNFHNIVWSTCLLPPLIMAFTKLFLVAWSRGISPIHKLKRAKRATRVMLFLLNFVYLRLCLLILAVFVCDEIMGHSYLRADYSIDCGTDEHRYMVILAICMMLFYPIGIPLTFLFILNRRQREVRPTALVWTDTFQAAS